MIVVSELLNDAIRTGFLFCMGIAMVRITWRSELARFTLIHAYHSIINFCMECPKLWLETTAQCHAVVRWPTSITYNNSPWPGYIHVIQAYTCSCIIEASQKLVWETRPFPERGGSPRLVKSENT